MCYNKSMRTVECLGLKTGATHYHEQLGLPDKGCTIKWLIVCNDWDVTTFGHFKQFFLMLLSTFPCMMYVYETPP